MIFFYLLNLLLLFVLLCVLSSLAEERSPKGQLIRESIISKTTTGTLWASILCPQSNPNNYLYQAKGGNRIYTFNLCNAPSLFAPKSCDYQLCATGPGTHWLPQQLGDFQYAFFTPIDDFSRIKDNILLHLTYAQMVDSSAPTAVRMTMKSMYYLKQPVVVYIDAYCPTKGLGNNRLIPTLPPFFSGVSETSPKQPHTHDQCFMFNGDSAVAIDPSDNSSSDQTFDPSSSGAASMATSKCPKWMNILQESPNFYHFQITLEELC